VSRAQGGDAIETKWRVEIDLRDLEYIVNQIAPLLPPPPLALR
jgi:hypothetical protein